MKARNHLRNLEGMCIQYNLTTQKYVDLASAHLHYQNHS